MIWTEKSKSCPKCDRVGKMQLLIHGGLPVEHCPFCGRETVSHAWYKVVNHRKAEEIIRTRKPFGLFLEHDGEKYIGIDNSAGDAWVEEFDTAQKCLEWLLEEGEGDDRGAQ